MVFESVISQILNKVLGEFVENLDGNQLNIGIWGGDVNLKDLVLKASALESLDLPIQTVYGKIGNLVLKVPWTSIYTKPTIIKIEDVYLLAQPNQQVAYDAQKEDKRLIEARKKEIEKIENAKKAEKEKDKDPGDPTLVQKVIQQVIKNAQVYIKNIHIRYEDKVTHPGRPFAIGVTLSELVVESTDSNWKRAIVEEVDKIYKIVHLEGLAVYWNCGTEIYSNLPTANLIARMKKEIATKDHTPPGYTYILGPITAGARLKMNQKPMADPQPYSIPIYHLNLDMGTLFIGISKAQYRDIIALADSMDRMEKGVPYRKYRPNVPYKGHYKEWWRFAYKCILVGEVQRNRNNWNWQHMLAHRNMGREYGELLRKNVKNACSPSEKVRLEECERKLDLTSIVIIRQRIELETEKLQELQKTSSKGWLSGWWGGSKSSKMTISEMEKTSNLLKQFENEMTPEEKARLYKAIDYQENAPATVFPEEFVDKSLSFLLRSLEIELRDDDDQVKTVVFTTLKGVKVKLETRVAAAALKVHVAIDHLKTDGLQQDDFRPVLFAPEEREIKGVKSLLDVTFETNPLDKRCDQRVHLVSKPLRIIYDAVTINKAVDIFKIPPDTSLDQIQAAASSKLTNVKEMTSTGLQFAIEQHTRLDIDVTLYAPHVIIPYGGKYQELQNVLVVDLGQIRLYSSGQRSSIMEVRKLYNEGLGQEEIFEKMKLYSYDHFKMELTDLQVLVAQGEEDWKQYIEHSASTEMHLLRPFSLNVEYSKCLISDDPRLPQQKITCELPSIDVSVSDARLMLLVALLTSIPFPESDEPPMEPLRKNKITASTSSLLKWQDKLPSTKTSPRDSNVSQEVTQFQLMEVAVQLSEISVVINQQETLTSAIHELATFRVSSLSADLLQRTSDTNVNLILGSVNLTQTRQDKIIKILSTPPVTDDQCLFKVTFTQVNPKSPDFHTTYQSCETSLGVHFSVLNVVLHQEGLLSLMAFSQSLMDTINEITETKGRPTARSSSGKLLDRLPSISELSDSIKVDRKPLPKKKSSDVVVESIKFKISAQMDEVTVNIATDALDVCSMSIRGLNADVFVKDTYTQVITKLHELVVIDLNPQTKHNLILTTEDENALVARVVLNNLDGESQDPDMDVDVRMGGTKIVFVNWFVTNLLNFLNQFQAAQQAIMEASQSAAQKAKENAKEMYQKATKIALNIRLRAPKLLVPVSSQSTDALLLDLGVISIRNQFLILDVKNEDGYSAVVDDMKITLTDLQQSKVKVDAKENVLEEWSMLKPINLEIKVKRNLSAGWYKDIPDVDVSGRIKVIDLHISQADYCMIMSVLSENLQEGKVETEVENQPEDTHHVLSRTSVVSGALEAGHKTDVVVETKEQVTVFLKFAFSMEEFIINLYSGGFKSNVKSTPDKKATNHLGRFSLQVLAIKGRILSDQSMVASILLVNCLLDDMRKDRVGKLNRLIERSVTEDSTSIASSDSVLPPRSMIDVTYQQTGNDMFADVRVFSFTVILSVEYLLKIAEFFSEPPDKIATSTAPAVARKGAKSSTSIGSQRGQTTRASQTAPPTQKAGQMTLNLKVEQPDIILVENMDSIDTNAMILNSEIVIKLRTSGDHQVINGLIKDLQLYTCSYNPARRLETKGNVLHPVTISLAGSTPEGKGLHVELLIEEVLLRVSPATIELLNSVLVTMSKGPTSEESEKEEQFSFQTLWEQKQFKDPDYWFLRSEEAQEVTEDTIADEAIATKTVLQELCIISMPSIVITVEAGVANKTVPFLLFETTLRGSARNWSSQLGVEASVTVLMGYYNTRLALWEPLIEPVEKKVGDSLTFEPWELKLELSMNEPDEGLNFTSPTSERGDEVEVPTNQPPVMSIDVTSEKSLELTVTKTCLEVLANLGKAFASAIKSEKMVSTSVLAPYRVLNEIGEDVTLLLDESSFKIAEGGFLEDINKSAAVPLVLKTPQPTVIQLGQELNRNEQEKNHFLQVKVNKTNCSLSLPVIRADKRFFMLNYASDGNNWGLISDVKVDEGVTLVTLRSILQVSNHFSVPIDVYYMTVRGNELELIGAVEPNGTLNIPLKAVYTPTGELFFGVSGYNVTTQAYIWKKLQTAMTEVEILKCPIVREAADSGKAPFLIKTIGEMEQVYYENTTRHTMASTCYNIHLRPAAILKNFLPLPLVVCVDELSEEIEVKAGDTLQLPNVEPGKSVIVIRLPDYLEKEWSCRKETELSPEEFQVWTFNSYDSATKMSLDLGMHTVNKDGSLIYSLYCPFWMLNKTGLMLGYRKSKKTEKNEAIGSPVKSSDENLNVLHHPADFKGPILFSFNPRNFFGKKKASIRVEAGDWSDKFSLDVAGSSGVVQCKANDQTYQIGVHNQLTYNSLTKQVTFTPYYVIINEAPYAIECQENGRPADPWTVIEPKSCSALWPKSEMEDKLLRLRIVGTEEISAPFLYTESHTTLLKLNNKYGGVNVDIQLNEGATYISFAPYTLGCAPAMIINHTNVDFHFWEKESVQIRDLKPKCSVLYTWENPSGPRKLVWEKSHKNEIENDLRKDGCGSFHVGEHEVFWTSFLDGMQRVLLFTEVRSLAETAINVFEIIQQEITVSLRGFGLSLVNNLTRQEIMYIGIASSGVIWETCKLNRKRYKPLASKESAHIENAYQRYLLQQGGSSDTSMPGIVAVDGKVEVDFDLQQMYKPRRRKIRRTYQTGVWLNMKTSPSQMQLHAKINRVQIDNQMYDCIFPVVLAPVPPPKSVAADSGIKPFVEVSIVQLLIKNSQIRQFKYFKVLVQEFHIKVDLGFVNAVVDMMQQSDNSDEEDRQLFVKDMNLVDEPLYAHASSQALQGQKSFYDLLHFSPLKIHVSFSLAAGSSAGQSASTPNFLNVLLQGVGVTLTDLQDVVFKLSFFERDYVFLNQQQLVSEATSHYVGQLIKQLYVLVLGLDVIGNPYGLVIGIGKGVEDLFYEPFQGAIQGPSEFAEGLALGVRSLVGHTVGGVMGAATRITGAMGKGIAALTFDEDFQRKRRDQINKKPTTVQEGIARSGKGLVMGVFDGVTGVFTKPVSGAKEQGVEGFFKGLGKGAVGLVTRPAAGLVDFASGSLDAVKRVAEVGGEDTSRLRPPRFLQADGLVRPYNSVEADGNKLLMELSKGKYATTDIYVYHRTIIEKKEIILLTDKRLAYIQHNDLFGGWQIDWAYTWQELGNPAKVVPKGVLITTSDGKKKKLFGSNDTSKTILIGDPAIREELCAKIEELRSA